MNSIFTVSFCKILAVGFLGGALIGTTGDFFHVYFDVDYYGPERGPFLPFLPVQMPFWVPLLMGSAGLGLMFTYGMIQKLFPNKTHHPFAAKLSRELPLLGPLFFLAQYCLSAILPLGTGAEGMYAMDFVMFIMAAAFWFFTDRTFFGAVFALSIAFLGTLFEINLVRIGGFEYLASHANFFGVPSWLPWLYVSAAKVPDTVWLRPASQK